MVHLFSYKRSIEPAFYHCTQFAWGMGHGYPRVLAPPAPLHNFHFIGDDVKSAGSIYQQLELAVSRSSGAPAQAARSCKLPSQKSMAPHPSPPAKVSKMSVRQGQPSSLQPLW